MYINKYYAKRLVIAISIVCTLLQSCTNQSANQYAQNLGANSKSNKMNSDYMILSRQRVIDQKGFNQPVEAFSFLLPKDWQVESSIDYQPQSRCLPEMVSAALQAKSPDGAIELYMLPVTQFDYSNDPTFLDVMQRGGFMYSCTIAPPTDAAGYIQKSLAPYFNAGITQIKPIKEFNEMMKASAQAMNQAASQYGGAYQYEGSSAEAILSFADGTEGLAFCTLMQTITTTPNYQGGQSSVIQCYVSSRALVKYKKELASTARKILSTFYSSARMNPMWTNAIAQMYANISRGAAIQLGRQIAINAQAQREVSDNIVRSWESSQSSSNNNQTEAFGQYLRGVENWTDAEGQKVELTSGYNSAWSKNDGTYLLSQDPSFDPNVAFNESWTRMEK